MEIKIEELEAREEMFDFDLTINGVKLCWYSKLFTN